MASYRMPIWVALTGVAFLIGWAAVVAVDHTDCDESGTIPLLLLGLGVVAVIAAMRVAGARLRWGIVAAIPYAAGVYFILVLHSIGQCTA